MIDFLRCRVFCAFVSLAIFIGFIGTYVYKWRQRGDAFVYSVDFTGGTQLLLGFSEPIHGERVADILRKNGWAGVETRAFSGGDMIVRLPLGDSSEADVAAEVQRVLEQEVSGVKVEIKQVDHVGAGIGETLRWKSLMAVFWGLLAMLFYIAFRFWSFAYAFGAVASLFHDAVVILGFFLLFDYEISFYVIGAILAILGYSINDTIVIFSRIRENVLLMPGVAIEEVVNISLNQTLRRTLLTSFATLLVVVSLLVFGGEVLRTLSLSLLIGIVFGTYSSIYIASPLMLLLYR